MLRTMFEIGDKSWHKHPGRLVGVLIMAYFTLKLAVILHLGLIGRPTEGMTGRLQDREPVPGESVIYFYQVRGNNYHGWRRGLEYGGHRLSVVYSPFYPRLHVVVAQRGLSSPLALWTTADYWLRILLALFGFGLGWGIYLLWTRQQQGRLRFHFLHGLHSRRHDG